MISVVLGPESGSEPLRLGIGYDDDGTPFSLRVTTLPVYLPDFPWVSWQMVGLKLRHNTAVTATVTPIIDGVIQTAQAMTLVYASPTGWVREIQEGRFFGQGQKCAMKIEIVAASKLFLEGCYIEARPSPTANVR